MDNCKARHRPHIYLLLVGLMGEILSKQWLTGYVVFLVSFSQTSFK